MAESRPKAKVEEPWGALRTPGAPPKLGVEPCVYTGRPRGHLFALELRAPRVRDAGVRAGTQGCGQEERSRAGSSHGPAGLTGASAPAESVIHEGPGARGAGGKCRELRLWARLQTREADDRVSDSRSGRSGAQHRPPPRRWKSRGTKSRAFPLRFSPRAGGWRGTGLPRWVWTFVRVRPVPLAQPHVSAGRRYLCGCSMRRCPGWQRTVQGSFTDGGSRGSTCPSEMGVVVRGAGVCYEPAKPGLGSASLSLTTWSNVPEPTFPALAAGLPPPRVAQSGDTTLTSQRCVSLGRNGQTLLCGHRLQGCGGAALPRRGWTVWLCL